MQIAHFAAVDLHTDGGHVGAILRRLAAPATSPTPRPERDDELELRCPEVTPMGPKPRRPDDGETRTSYTPDARCIDLKALQYDLLDYRSRGIF